MSEADMCCGTIADKAKLKAEIKSMQAEIDGLKAQNDILLVALENEAKDCCGIIGDPVSEWREYVADAYDNTPAQCLAQVKHDSIIEGIQFCKMAIYQAHDDGELVALAIYHDLQTKAANLLTQSQGE